MIPTAVTVSDYFSSILILSFHYQDYKSIHLQYNCTELLVAYFRFYAQKPGSDQTDNN